MAIAFVQAKSAANSGSGADTTASLTLTSAPTNGNTLLLLSGSNATITSISQTGATWAADSTANTGGNLREVWRATNVSGASTGITVNYSAGTAAFIICEEYSGLTNVSPFDKTANNTGTSASPDSGTTATTTQANELWWGGGWLNGGGSVPTISAPTNSFTGLVQQRSANGTGTATLFLAHNIVSSTGAADVSFTSSVSGTWYGIIATYEATLSTNSNQLMMQGIGT